MDEDRVLRALDKLQEGQSDMRAQLASLRTAQDEEDKRVSLFWGKDWDPLLERVRALEKQVNLIVVGFAQINGLPTRNEARLNGIWKWIGLIGGLGIVAGGVGSFLMEFIMRRIIGG